MGRILASITPVPVLLLDYSMTSTLEIQFLRDKENSKQPKLFKVKQSILHSAGAVNRLRRIR